MLFSGASFVDLFVELFVVDCVLFVVFLLVVGCWLLVVGCLTLSCVGVRRCVVVVGLCCLLFVTRCGVCALFLAVCYFTWCC